VIEKKYQSNYFVTFWFSLWEKSCKENKMGNKRVENNNFSPLRAVSRAFCRGFVILVDKIF